MKFDPTESYETWVNRIQADEYVRAQKQIAQGVDPNKVIEEFSKRMTQKLLHPILVALRGSPNNYDVDKGKAEYYAKMNIRGPVADHILDDNDK